MRHINPCVDMEQVKGQILAVARTLEGGFLTCCIQNHHWCSAHLPDLNTNFEMWLLPAGVSTYTVL